MINTRSRARLQRYADRIGVRGTILFQPEADLEMNRYLLRLAKTEQLLALGKNAQAARFMLTAMNGGKREPVT